MIVLDKSETDPVSDTLMQSCPEVLHVNPHT